MEREINEGNEENSERHKVIKNVGHFMHMWTSFNVGNLLSLSVLMGGILPFSWEFGEFKEFLGTLIIFGW